MGKIETNPPVLVIGVGNEMRSDDAVGLHVARAVRARALPGVTVAECESEGSALIDCWQGYDNVIVIDAVSNRPARSHGDNPEGATVHECDARSTSLSTELFHHSTHAFGVAEAIEVARRLHKLPRSLMIYGIEGLSFGIGDRLSEPVARSVGIAVERITARISGLNTVPSRETPVPVEIPSSQK